MTREEMLQEDIDTLKDEIAIAEHDGESAEDLYFQLADLKDELRNLRETKPGA